MTQTLWLTLDWRNAASDLSESQQEALTQSLFRDFQTLDAVEQVQRIADPEVPAGGMGAQWLWSILTAEITIEGIKQVAAEAHARLPRKPMTFTVKVGDQEIRAENVRPGDADFDAVLTKLMAAAKELNSNN
jgi:hypothetical protein